MENSSLFLHDRPKEIILLAEDSFREKMLRPVLSSLGKLRCAQ
jgi:hypothetical protein